MTFRATNVLPEKGYERAKQTASGLRRFCDTLSAQIASGGNATQIFAIVDSLVSFKTNLNEVSAIPGLNDYAKEQENDPLYDLATEFTLLIALIDAAITQVVTAIPKDGSGFLLMQTIDANGVRSPRAFTGVQLAPLTTALINIRNGIS